MKGAFDAALEVVWEEPCPLSKAALPLIAITVCTRQRPQMLRQCLQSLLAQRVDASRLRWVIVVVENGDMGPAHGVFEAVCPDPTPHCFVCEPVVGIPFARNRGIETALALGADFVAFIDDDEVAPPDWLDALYEALIACGADVLQGCVRQISQGAGQAALVGLSARGDAKTRRAETAATSNTLMRTWVVREPHCLRFDEGMRYSGGSDLEFFMRAHKAGAQIMRTSGVVVLEELAPERETLAYRARRSLASGSNYYARIAKNCAALTAMRRIAFRAIGNALTGIIRVLSGIVHWPMAPHSARRVFESGATRICFALGCCGAILGLHPKPYLRVVGD